MGEEEVVVRCMTPGYGTGLFSHQPVGGSMETRSMANGIIDGFTGQHNDGYQALTYTLHGYGFGTWGIWHSWLGWIEHGIEIPYGH